MDAGIRVSASTPCGGAVSSRCDGSALFDVIKLLGTGFPERVAKIAAYSEKAQALGATFALGALRRDLYSYATPTPIFEGKLKCLDRLRAQLLSAKHRTGYSRKSSTPPRRAST